MTEEDIIRMAREAGWSYMEAGMQSKMLERFAALVAAAEREACAKVCDELGQSRHALEHYASLTYAGATHDCSAAIRARGESK